MLSKNPRGDLSAAWAPQETLKEFSRQSWLPGKPSLAHSILESPQHRCGGQEVLGKHCSDMFIVALS
jgi:hypothetical protein